MDDQNFYIRIEDGKPVDYPISHQNLKVFLPDLDPNNPPAGFAKLVIPSNPDKQPNGNITYEFSDYYTDLYHTKTYIEVYRPNDVNPTDVNPTDVDPTDVELVGVDKDQKVRPDQSDWVYDEKSEKWVPPLPDPDTSGDYVWSSPADIVYDAPGKWIKKDELQILDGPDEIEGMVEYIKINGPARGMTEENIQKLVDRVRNTVPLVNGQPANGQPFS